MHQVGKIIKSYKSLLISVSILTFCLVGSVFGVVPAGKKIVEYTQSLSALSADVAQLRRKLTFLESLDEGSLRVDLTGLLSAIPSDKSMPTLFGTVEGIAAQSGVILVDMSVGGVGSVATSSAAPTSTVERQIGARLVPFSVTVEGSLDNLRQFISLVGTVRRLLRTRTFSLALSSSGKPTTATFQMDAFYEALPSDLGALGKDISGLTEEELVTITRVNNMPLMATISTLLPPSAAMPLKSNPFAP